LIRVKYCAAAEPILRNELIAPSGEEAVDALV